VARFDNHCTEERFSKQRECGNLSCSPIDEAHCALPSSVTITVTSNGQTANHTETVEDFRSLAGA
jgi:hypothetical protein